MNNECQELNLELNQQYETDISQSSIEIPHASSADSMLTKKLDTIFFQFLLILATFVLH